MAQAAGLPMVGEHKNPAKTTTFGVGSLIRDAVEQGCKNIVIGLGGSCTNDAGAGAAAALGTKFYNEKGESFVPTGDTLEQIVSYDTAETERLLPAAPSLPCATSTTRCTARRARRQSLRPRRARMKKWSRFWTGISSISEISCSRKPGQILQTCQALALRAHSAQASSHFWAASSSPALRPSLECVRFDELLAGADMVFTGEGQMDSQSLHGKAVIGIAGRAAKKHVPVTVIVGSVGDGAEGGYEMGVSAIFSINRRAESFDISRGKTRQNFEATMDAIVRLLALKA